MNIEHVSVDDDFFRDLKGNSLLAAHVVTELRKRLGTLNISVKDIYEYRTITNIATHLSALGVGSEEAKEAARAAAENVAESPLRVNIATRWFCVFLKTVSLGLYYAVLSAPLVFFILICERAYIGRMDFSTAAGISTLLGFATWPVWLFISIAVKWLA